jgi:hypothetical protein
MRLLKVFSRTLHFAMLFCFCLPFLKGCDGCGPSADELAAREMASRDSIMAVEAARAEENMTDSSDSLLPEAQQFTLQCEPPVLPSDDDKPFWERFLVTILEPDGDYSGLGLLVLSIQLGGATLAAILFPFITLVIISLIISFRKKTSFKLIFIFSVIEIVCLLAFYILFCNSAILYGYWLTLFLCLIHSILAFFIWRRLRDVTK